MIQVNARTPFETQSSIEGGWKCISEHTKVRLCACVIP